MKKLFLLILPFILISVSTLEAEDRRSHPNKLIIMTFNAEFLWDGVEPEEGRVNFAWKGSKDESEERMKGNAQIINQSNPDIINVVEVESLVALKTLNDKFLF